MQFKSLKNTKSLKRNCVILNKVGEMRPGGRVRVVFEILIINTDVYV